MEEFVVESAAMIQFVVAVIVLICFFVLVARVKVIKKATLEIAAIQKYRAKVDGLFIQMKCAHCNNHVIEGIPGTKVACENCTMETYITRTVESSQTDKTDKS